MQSGNKYSQIVEMSQEVAIADILPVRVDRQKGFRIWLIAANQTVTMLASRLRMTQSSLSKAMAGERMPVQNFNALVSAGVPAQLLPRPEDVRPGPKAKHTIM